MSAGRLVVCPTPIGNLGDVTLRVLDALRSADVVACEDTRHTRVLLDRHGVRAASLVSYHEHNESPRAAELVARLRTGATVALVSDAGMPSVSDPGFVLVRAALDARVRVEVLPGPSAVLVAVVASGLPADRWRFVGFLPRKASDLPAVFASVETVVAFESPRRLARSLAALAAVDPARPVAVCRELTKVHEEVVRGDAATVAAHFTQTDPRGEIVVVIGAAAAVDADFEPAVDALARLVEAGARTRPAAKVVAELTGTHANALYEALQSRGG
ncbi:MAG TPA: 16S rRNA (cytidine(1402)-2'-O)-methyltransferase [Solirubrobacteraceae bacterium]|nr:16S rRNA (cytidine(1402)-2'-O)-methyltransferase [Solirubrobacteraceae bacterium]